MFTPPPPPPGLTTSASARESFPSRESSPSPPVPSGAPPSASGPTFDGRAGSSLDRRFASFARFSAARSSRDFCRMMSRMLFASESSTAASAPAPALARCEPGRTRFPRVVLAERTAVRGRRRRRRRRRRAGTEGGGIAARASRLRASLSSRLSFARPARRWGRRGDAMPRPPPLRRGLRRSRPAAGSGAGAAAGVFSFPSAAFAAGGSARPPWPEAAPPPPVRPSGRRVIWCRRGAAASRARDDLRREDAAAGRA